MRKLEFYVPLDYAERVKNAVFAAGGGRIGDYDQCCWETEGVGQFRPLNGSRPFIGEAGGGVERVRELKIEMVCNDDKADAAVEALLEAHPYETPAYQLWKL